MRKEKLYFIVIILITFLAYINILQNNFVWDDHQFIEEWSLTRSFKNINSFFKGAVPTAHKGVYRPLRGVFYTVSYKLWRLNPVGYHIQSVFVHLTCTLLIYFIATEITKKRFIGFMTAVLFGVHPIHTEAVSPAAASFDVIGVILFFASFYLYLKAQSVKDKYESRYIMSIIFAVLAFFTYEITLVLPFLMVFCDVCFKKIQHGKLIRKLKIYAPYFVSAMFYLFIRFFILGIWGKGSYFAGSFYLTMLTMSKACLKYIYLILFPINLNFNHPISEGILSYVVTDLNEEAVIAQSIFNLHIVFSIAVIVILLIIAVKGLKNYPLVSFCMGWFFIGLLPVSNIIPQLIILSEKYLYIASFGFCLLFSFLIYHLYFVIAKKNKWLKKGLIVFFVFVILFYGIITIDRNKDWKDDLTLWSKTVEQSPESAFAHNNLGWVLHLQGKTELALEEYRKAIMINPRLFEVYYNIGLAYKAQGKTELAIEAYKEAIKVNPTYPQHYYELGKAYEEEGDIDLAIESYKKALEINPKFYEVHYNLGNAYYTKGEIDNAVKEYEKAIAINPNYVNALINLGNLYYIKGYINMAINKYRTVLAVDPDNAKARKNLRLAVEKIEKDD